MLKMGKAVDLDMSTDEDIVMEEQWQKGREVEILEEWAVLRGTILAVK